MIATPKSRDESSSPIDRPDTEITSRCCGAAKNLNSGAILLVVLKS